MLFGATEGSLEIRKRASNGLLLAGRFPYGKRATLSDGGRNGGRPKKEVIAPRAFAFRVEKPEEEIHLLLGHDFNRPLASRAAGSLTLEDTPDALSFEATITDAMRDTTHVRDALAMVSAGLAVGLSPGFRVPPQRTVPDAETVEEEDPSEGTALIRTVNQALLYEVSIVARPAYSEASVETVEARSWDLTTDPAPRPIPAIARWR